MNLVTEKKIVHTLFTSYQELSDGLCKGMGGVAENAPPPGIAAVLDISPRAFLKKAF